MEFFKFLIVIFLAVYSFYSFCVHDMYIHFLSKLYIVVTSVYILCTCYSNAFACWCPTVCVTSVKCCPLWLQTLIAYDPVCIAGIHLIICVAGIHLIICMAGIHLIICIAGIHLIICIAGIHLIICIAGIHLIICIAGIHLIICIAGIQPVLHVVGMVGV